MDVTAPVHADFEDTVGALPEPTLIAIHICYTYSIADMYTYRALYVYVHMADYVLGIEGQFLGRLLMPASSVVENTAYARVRVVEHHVRRVQVGCWVGVLMERWWGVDGALMGCCWGVGGVLAGC